MIMFAIFFVAVRRSAATATAFCLNSSDPLTHTMPPLRRQHQARLDHVRVPNLVRAKDNPFAMIGERMLAIEPVGDISAQLALIAEANIWLAKIVRSP